MSPGGGPRDAATWVAPDPSPWLVRTCAAGLAAFVALLAAAVARYPGGTWFDPRAPGHSFWKNFLCDLFQRRALNGADNRASAAFATAGAVAMLLALAAFFALVARLEGDASRAGRVTRRAGLLASLAGLGVPLTPSDEGRALHLTAVLVACAPALAAVIAAARVCARVGGSRAARVFSRATLAFGATDLAAYATAYALPFRVRWLNELLPVFQRLALLSLVGWMLAVLAALPPRRRRG